ncbi:hypothetical protein Tco_0686592 [Tanacetum coccineum]
MTTLKFTDTHNMVVFLTKPAESEGFEQIVDFLNVNPLRYALMINPTIYISCIEQFWSIVKAKTVNGEVQLQALVDRKKIIITESTVRRDLQLEDAEGVDCLPNSTIFEQLTLMGYEKISQKLTFYKAFFSPQWKFLIHTILQCLSSKTTAWNEFSSTMASSIICLAIKQKFNFSKYIFESMVKNLDNAGNFFMYPRVGKGFSGRETSLFQTMVVQAQAQMGEADEAVNEEMDDSLERAATTTTSLDTEHDRANINKTQSKATPNKTGSQGTTSGGGNTFWSGEGSLKLNELMELCTNLQQRVLDLETIKTTQANEIASLKRRGRIADIDANKDNYLVNVHTDEDMFGVNDLDGDEVIVDNVDVVKTAEEIVNAAATIVNTASIIPVSAATTTTTTTTTATTDVEVTLAQALAEMKSAKPKAVKTVVEQVKPMKGLKQMRLDEELAFKLQAEEEEERLAKEKAH